MQQQALRRFTGIPNAALLAEAAACVSAGGTLIFPTDTVYGIGCAPDDAAAIAAVFAAKHRSPEKPLSVHVALAADALRFALEPSRAMLTLMAQLWPGPLTIIARRAPGIADAAAPGRTTIGLRCPDDDACRAILAAVGPLAATSANFSGESAYDGSDVDVSRLPDATLALLKGPTSLRRESTVLDCSGAFVRVVRHGALADDIIRAVLDGIAVLES